MKILGINGSPRQNGTTAKLVQEILNASGTETELIHLGGKRISACIACLACAKDNVCVLKDDMVDLRDKLVEADALVIGGANYYSMLNALTHSFIERFYQFYHNNGTLMAGKPFVAVGTGGANGDSAAEQIKALLEYNRMEHFGAVSIQGALPCFSCGFGDTCEVSAIPHVFGQDTEVTPDIIPSLEKQPEVLAQARDLGRRLGERVQNGTSAS